MAKKSSYFTYSLLFSIISICLLCLALSFYVRSNSFDAFSVARGYANTDIILKEDHIQFNEYESETGYMETQGETLYIYGPGKYHFTGSLKNGQIIVDAANEDSIILEFENVTLHSESSAPIWIRQAGKVTIQLTSGSSSHFSDGAGRMECPAGEKIPEACIYARCDLTIQGENSKLIIDGNYKEGIHTSDHLILKESAMDIHALSTGIKGHDSFTTIHSDLRITASKDGIYSTGPVALQGGNLQIVSGKYGIFGREWIDADSSCQIAIEGALSPLASNGSIHCEMK